MDTVVAGHPDNLAVIRYHTWWPGSGDPYYQANIPENTARTNYYGADYVPHFHIDGNIDGGYNPSPWESMVTSRAAIASPLEIVLQNDYNSSTRSGTITATVTNTGTGAISGYLQFVLTETGIPGSYAQNQTMRDMLPDANGESISLPTPGSSVVKSRNYTVSTAWVADSCELVVFVQNNSTKEIYQGAKVNVTPRIPPPVTVSLTGLTAQVRRRGTLRYERVMRNTTSESQTFLFWSKVKLPNNRWRQAVPPTTFTLAPLATRTDTVSHTVPNAAPIGSYEYWGYVGPDVSTQWNSDSFAFTVTGD